MGTREGTVISNSVSIVLGMLPRYIAANATLVWASINHKEERSEERNTICYSKAV